MHLVILAAGHGRRFGGLKQLAPVGPDGQPLIDYTALDAAANGFGPIVLVVREDIREEVTAHVKTNWPSSLECQVVVQEGIAGTAQAVLSAAPAVVGPFGVANADDFYGAAAFELLAQRLDRASEEADGEGAQPHLIVGFQLSDTIFTGGTVTRGVCRLDLGGELVDIVEQRVTPLEGEQGGYAGVPASAEPGSAAQPLSGEEVVSMNLWGFQGRIFDHLRAAVEAFDPPPPAPDDEKPPELLLPDVVQELVRAGLDRVSVATASGQCFGITHPEDMEFVRRELEDRRPGDPAPTDPAQPS